MTVIKLRRAMSLVVALLAVGMTGAASAKPGEPLSPPKPHIGR